MFAFELAHPQRLFDGAGAADVLAEATLPQVFFVVRDCLAVGEAGTDSVGSSKKGHKKPDTLMNIWQNGVLESSNLSTPQKRATKLQFKKSTFKSPQTRINTGRKGSRRIM